MSNFRENLKQELIYQDIRVKELAEKSGVSKRTIDHYLAENSSEPLAEAAYKIAKALNVTVEYLMTGIDPECASIAKNEVLELIPALNRLSSDDFSLVSSIIKRFKDG